MPSKQDPTTTADNLRESIAALIEAGIYTTDTLKDLLMSMYIAEVEAGRMSEDRAERIGTIANEMKDALHDPERLRRLYLQAFEELIDRKFLQRRKSLDGISRELSQHNARLWSEFQKEQAQFEEDISAGRYARDQHTRDQIEKGRHILADIEASFIENVKRRRQLRELVGEIESEIVKGKVKPQRALRLRAVLAELEEILDAPLDDDAEVIKARNMRYREILASLSGAIAAPTGKPAYVEGSRAHTLDGFLTDLKAAFLEEIARPGILDGEKSLINHAGAAAVTAEQTLEGLPGDEDAIELEQETVRPAALELKQYRLRHHLTLIEPVWQAPRSAVQNPNSVFFSGTVKHQALVASVCRKLALTLLPTIRAGTDAARFRWQQLWTSHVAVFDLSSYDPSAPVASAARVAAICYELGMAFSLGRSVVILAREAQTLPFDIDVLPVCLPGGADNELILGNAIDSALYETQRGTTDSSLRATLDYARRFQAGDDQWIDSKTSADPVQTRRLLQHSLGRGGSRRHVPVLPAWPGAYPDPNSPRCFHVMGFRPELNWTAELASKLCQENGVTYVRGDRVIEPDIIRSIWDEICHATHVLVDLTGCNPNVFVELGIVHTLGRNVVIVSSNESSIGAIPSLAKVRVHLYSRRGTRDTQALAKVVADFLMTRVESGPTQEGH